MLELILTIDLDKTSDEGKQMTSVYNELHSCKVIPNPKKLDNHAEYVDPGLIEYERVLLFVREELRNGYKKIRTSRKQSR